MVASLVTMIIRLAALALLLVVSDQLVALVPADPGAATRMLCAVLMVTVVITGIWRMMQPRTIRVHSKAMDPTLMESSIRAGFARVDDDFQLERRARHEAAHAVLAYHFGKPGIRADVIRNHRIGGSVSYDGVQGSVADIAYQDMQITFGGHVVDVAGGYIDGGSQEDMRYITDNAMMILSTGARPEGFAGRISAERLVRAARDDAAGILKQLDPEVERIAAALVEKRRLGTDEITRLMTNESAETDEAAA